MSETTTSGNRGGRAAADTAAELLPGADLSVNPPETIEPRVGGPAIVGRSPGQLAWMRLKRDRVAVMCAWVLGVFGAVVLLAPLIEWLYGDDPTRGHTELLDSIGFPLGYSGGASADHWLGLTPQRGYDLLLQIIFGARTSLGIAGTAALAAAGIGILIGIVAGYAGGWIDRALVWLTDFMLAFPFFLFAIALVPTIGTRLADEHGEIAVWKRVVVLIVVFTMFNWMYMARIVRGQVISLREREYVDAARAAGAGSAHIIFRQLLPNLWAPVLVVVSLLIPQLVTAEAAFSFLNIGIQEPTPDLGRLILLGARNVLNSGLIPGTVFLPALLLFVLVLAFNLLGDAIRDALDPRSSK
jgi:peptide/nickel transport system permease protein